MRNLVRNEVYDRVILFALIAVMPIFTLSESLSSLNTKKFQCNVRQKQSTKISCFEAYEKLEKHLLTPNYQEADLITKN